MQSPPICPEAQAKRARAFLVQVVPRSLFKEVVNVGDGIDSLTWPFERHGVALAEAQPATSGIP